jgi:hypothetical protein
MRHAALQVLCMTDDAAHAIIHAMRYRMLPLPFLMIVLVAAGCAGVRLSQPSVTPSGRYYAVAPDTAWQQIADYVTASSLGIRSAEAPGVVPSTDVILRDPRQGTSSTSDSHSEDRVRGLIVTDYVYERNALGLVSARYRNHYRIHLTPEGDGTRVEVAVVCEEDPEMNGVWRDITAPDKAEALAGALWEVLDPLL